MDKVQKIQQYFKEHNLFVDEISEDKGHIVISIDWGDWKHEHGYCDYLMTQLGYIVVSQHVTEEDGSDCYSADHYYIEESKVPKWYSAE